MIATEQEAIAVVKALLMTVRTLTTLMPSESNEETKTMMEADINVMRGILDKVLPDYEDMLK